MAFAGVGDGRLGLNAGRDDGRRQVRSRVIDKLPLRDWFLARALYVHDAWTKRLVLQNLLSASNTFLLLEHDELQ